MWSDAAVEWGGVVFMLIGRREKASGGSGVEKVVDEQTVGSREM